MLANTERAMEAEAPAKEGGSRTNGLWDDPARVVMLKSLYTTTSLSMTAMGDRMNAQFKEEGFNRNSIAGKLTRLGIIGDRVVKNKGGSRNGKPAKGRAVLRPRVERYLVQRIRNRTDAVTKPVPEPAPKPVAQPVTVEQVEAVIISIGIPITELGADTCHWPLGKFLDHPPYLYCGRKSLGSRPYCAHHWRLGHVAKG